MVNFVEFLKNHYDQIKFMMEIKRDGTLPFLDMLLIKQLDWSLVKEVY